LGEGGSSIRETQTEDKGQTLEGQIHFDYHAKRFGGYAYVST